MSREIKFRLWDKVQGVMLQKDPLSSEPGESITLDGHVYSFGKLMDDYMALRS